MQWAEPIGVADLPSDLELLEGAREGASELTIVVATEGMGSTRAQRQDKRSQYLTLDGKRVRVSYDTLPEELTSGFQAKSPDAQLQAIREYSTVTNSRSLANGFKKKARHAVWLGSHIVPDVPEEMDEEVFGEVTKRMLGIYSRIILNADEGPDFEALSRLITKYAEDTQAIGELGFMKPYTVALGHSPVSCADALVHYDKLGIPKRQIVSTFTHKTNAEALLDRYLSWLPGALEKYRGLYFQKSIVEQLVYRAAFSHDPEQVERKVEGYLRKVRKLEDMRTELPGLTDSAIGRLAITNRAPEVPAASYEKQRVVRPKAARSPSKRTLRHRAVRQMCDEETIAGGPLVFRPFPDDPYVQIRLDYPEETSYKVLSIETEDIALRVRSASGVLNNHGEVVPINEEEKLTLSLFALGASTVDVHRYAMAQGTVRPFLYDKLGLLRTNNITRARRVAEFACRTLLVPSSTNSTFDMFERREAAEFSYVAHRMATGCPPKHISMTDYSYYKKVDNFRGMFGPERGDSLLITVAHAAGILSLKDTKLA